LLQPINNARTLSRPGFQDLNARFQREVSTPGSQDLGFRTLKALHLTVVLFFLVTFLCVQWSQTDGLDLCVQWSQTDGLDLWTRRLRSHTQSLSLVKSLSCALAAWFFRISSALSAWFPNLTVHADSTGGLKHGTVVSRTNALREHKIPTDMP